MPISNLCWLKVPFGTIESSREFDILLQQFLSKVDFALFKKPDRGRLKLSLIRKVRLELFKMRRHPMGLRCVEEFDTQHQAFQGNRFSQIVRDTVVMQPRICLLYTSDAADE